MTRVWGTTALLVRMGYRVSAARGLTQCHTFPTTSSSGNPKLPGRYYMGCPAPVVHATPPFGLCPLITRLPHGAVRWTAVRVGALCTLTSGTCAADALELPPAPLAVAAAEL